MDINIRVRVDSPDIMNALLALAEALPQMKTRVQIKEEPKEVQASKEKEEAKTITLEEVRSVLAKLSQDGKQKEVKELIKKFGSKKLTDIPKDKYPELLKEVELI